MTSWSSSIKICFYKLIESIIKKMSWCETECKKNVPLDKQNVMKLEVFILGRQIIDQKREKGWGRLRRERIGKGSRERIEIERKETKGNSIKDFKRNIDTCLSLLFSFLKALSSRLDSAVKRSSSEL